MFLYNLFKIGGIPMHTSAKHMLLLALMSCCSANHLLATSPFTTYKQQLDQLETKFDQCFHQCNQINKNMWKGLDVAMEQTSIDIKESKETNTVDIIIAPLTIKEKTFSAQFDEDKNMLELNTPAGKVMLQVERHMLSVSFDHQVEAEQKDNKAHVIMSSYNQSTARVSNEMFLDQTAIEYDETTKKLIATIPFRKKIVTKIPVTIKETSKKAEDK